MVRVTRDLRRCVLRHDLQHCGLRRVLVHHALHADDVGDAAGAGVDLALNEVLKGLIAGARTTTEGQRCRPGIAEIVLDHDLAADAVKRNGQAGGWRRLAIDVGGGHDAGRQALHRIDVDASVVALGSRGQNQTVVLDSDQHIVRGRQSGRRIQLCLHMISHLGG